LLFHFCPLPSYSCCARCSACARVLAVSAPNEPDRVVRTFVGEAQTDECLDEALWLTFAETLHELVAKPDQSEMGRRIARIFEEYCANGAVAIREKLSLWYKYEE
jgi:hypothetical protein